MSAPTIEELGTALDVAGYVMGEVVEFGALQGRDGQKQAPRILRCGYGEAGLNSAVSWLAGQAKANEFARSRGRASEGGLYFGSNPLLDALGDRAADADVREVRQLLLDVDPVGMTLEARAASAQCAEDLLRLLKEIVGLRPPLIDSGRGRQLWLRHEPVEPSDKDALGLRRRLLAGLAARLDVELARVDTAVHNPSRLMRLPGTVNLRTCDRATVIDRGDGRVLTLADVERLLCALERRAPTECAGDPSPAPSSSTRSGVAEAAPTTAVTTTGSPGSDAAALSDLRGLLGCLPCGHETWAWLGAQASRTGSVEQARAAVPEAGLRAYDEGVAAGAVGARFPRPSENAIVVRRLERTLERLALPPEAGSTALSVRRVVHNRRPRSLGGDYDVEVATVRAAAVLRGLPAKDLLSYPAVRAHALAVGMYLPELPQKRAKAIWATALEQALELMEVVNLPESGEAEIVTEDAIRDVVASAVRGESVDDLDQGHVVVRDNEALITVRALTRGVQAALRDDPPSRADIMRVAQGVGGRPRRSTRIDGRRKDVLAFPLTGDDQPSPSPSPPSATQ